MTNILLSPSGAVSELAKELENFAARLITWPTPHIGEPESYLELDEAIENLFGYDWLILKNIAAAQSFLRRFQLQHQTSELDELRVLAIGETAREELLDSAIHIDLAVERFSLAGVFDSLAAYAGGVAALARLNFLIPSANIATEQFAEELGLAGARLDDVKSYVTIGSNHQLIQLKTLLLGGGIDGVVFTGASDLAGLAQVFDSDDLSRVLGPVKVVCTDQEALEFSARFGLAESIGCFEPTAGRVAGLIAASQRR